MYHFLAELIRPLPLVMILLVIGMARLWLRRREAPGRLWWVIVPTAILWLICAPIVGHLAIRTLEWRYPVDARPPERDEFDAIVVLSGGLEVHDAQGRYIEVSPDTMYRCSRGALLYRQMEGDCPLVLCGGKVEVERPGPMLADAMREFMLTAGVDPEDLIVENESTTTYENALYACRLLQGREITRIALVTDALHMTRSVACFEAQGVAVVAVPCQYRASRMQWSVGAFLPSADAADCVDAAFHEWLGLLWYWWHDCI